MVLFSVRPPLMAICTASIPSVPVVVSLSVIVVGALILTTVLLLPSTVNPSRILTLSKITSSLVPASPPSSEAPVTVGIGILNVASVPS